MSQQDQFKQPKSGATAAVITGATMVALTAAGAAISYGIIRKGVADGIGDDRKAQAEAAASAKDSGFV